MRRRTPFMNASRDGFLVRTVRLLVAAAVLGAASSIPADCAFAQRTAAEAEYIRAHYDKREAMIPMRDGVKLFTAIYVPKDTGKSYPLLLTRTPYSAGPYGVDNYPRYLGPGSAFPELGYIFITQDVRGRYRSEGHFEHMTPHKAVKKGPRDVDESTDTWDTIEWLLHNVPHNNGKAGLWGISYGGFFTAAGMLSGHPALKAASPQAPQADWFMGDDTHHNGAFFLTSTFNFMAWCGRKGEGTSMSCGKGFDFGTDDGYRFFLEMGPLANAEKMFFKGSSPGWTDMMRHGTYDAFWQARNILPHMRYVKPAVLTVGGWYDANNYYGALKLFEAIEKQSPATDNAIVIGPWDHGQWARDSGATLGGLAFGARTADWYQKEILAPFFETRLKSDGQMKHPKAWVFETGTNRWRTFDRWPPQGASTRAIYLGANRTLSSDPPSPSAKPAVEEWVSDPANPVPFVPKKSTDMDPDYMAQDQRFDAGRSDVVSYNGEPLSEDLTIAGPIRPTLYVSTTGTDGDWVVKLIDVHPDGFEELVRGDVMRAKFRNSFTRPEPLVPGKVAKLDFEMPDVFHTFKRGHRMVVRVQGSWFPLVDRNPQTFVDIYKARPRDFRKATQRVVAAPGTASRLEVRVLSERVVP